MTKPWEAASAQLAGLLKLRDGVEALAKEHEAKAFIFRGNGRVDSAEVHDRYAKRLRAMLPTA